MRLDRYLARSGRYSRSEARKIIQQGRVRVNFLEIHNPGYHLKPGDRVEVDGEVLAYEAHVYLMLNKPAGLVSSTTGEDSVLTLLPDEFRRRGVFPAGRLDRDTEGLLLLTNDGQLAQRLLHPKRQVPREYLVTLDAPLSPEQLGRLLEGLTLRDGHRARFEAVDPTGLPRNYRVVLREGRYHEVKRLFAAAGRRVIYLKRVAFGPLRLDPDLPPGRWRPLTAEELQALRRALGLAASTPR